MLTAVFSGHSGIVERRPWMIVAACSTPRHRNRVSHPFGARKSTSTAQSLHVSLDFDGTMTIADTIERLAGFGYHHNQQHSTDIRERKDVVAAYVEDMRRHVSTYKQSIEKGCAFLASSKEIERRNVHRVEMRAYSGAQGSKRPTSTASKRSNQVGPACFMKAGARCWDTFTKLVDQ